jgi:glutathione synthase/RimK-type ligase-like ATP-grasp enzyme
LELALIAQRIEQTRPKGKMGVQFLLGAPFMKNILIFSVRDDVHVEAVLKHIDPKTNIFLHNTDALHNLIVNECRISLAVDGIKIIRADGLEIIPDDLTAVWYRKPSFWDADPGKSYHKILDYRLKLRENMEVVNALFKVAGKMGVYCMNSAESIEYCNSKPIQLQIAHDFGLTTPEWIISSNVNEITEFINHCHDQVVIKRLSGNISYGKWSLVSQTTKYSLDEFTQRYQGYRELDYCFFVQKLIEKDYDIRITFVHNQLFPCAVYSQENTASKIDCRLVEPQFLQHSPINLPPEISKNILALCANYDLRYAAIDFAKGVDGNYYFFEVNPCGQYLWIEEQTGMPISKKIAESLESDAHRQ